MQLTQRKKQSLKIENWVSKRIGKSVYRISLNDNIKQNKLIKLGLVLLKHKFF